MVFMKNNKKETWKDKVLDYALCTTLAVTLPLNSWFLWKIFRDNEVNYSPRPEVAQTQEARPVGSKLEEKIEKVVPKTEVRQAQNVDYRTNDFSKDSDAFLLARMLYGEARNCSKEEKIAIAYTALNRIHDGVDWNGKTLRRVLLNPWQYSCFINYSWDNINKTEDKKLKEIKRNINLNRQRLMNPAKEEFAECLDAASGVLSGKYSDSTNGATHYHTSEIRPDWAGKMSNRKMPANFRHLFYREN